MQVDYRLLWAPHFDRMRTSLNVRLQRDLVWTPVNSKSAWYPILLPCCVLCLLFSTQYSVLQRIHVTVWPWYRVKRPRTLDSAKCLALPSFYLLLSTPVSREPCACKASWIAQNCVWQRICIVVQSQATKLENKYTIELGNCTAIRGTHGQMKHIIESVEAKRRFEDPNHSPVNRTWITQNLLLEIAPLPSHNQLASYSSGKLIVSWVGIPVASWPIVSWVARNRRKHGQWQTYSRDGES